MSLGAVLPALPVALPLTFSALLGLGGKHTPRRLADALGIAVAAAVTGIAGWLAWRARADPQVYWLGGWRLRDGEPLGIALSIDEAGATFATLGALLTTLALVFAVRWFDSVGALFHALVLAFLAGVCGFCLTGDLFNLFVWFELMTAAGVALCAYKSEEPQSLQGGMAFAVINTLGAFLLVIGLALVYGRTGALNLAQLGRALDGAPDLLVAVAFACLAIAFLVKAAIVPFHFWLADAHAVAPTPVCVLFSGILVELGLLGLMRVHAIVFAATLPPARLRALWLLGGGATALGCAVMSFAQRHLKRLLAYSTASHMGVALAGFGLGSSRALAGSLAYLVGHSLTKAALFLGAGLVLHLLHDVDELELRGRGRPHPWVGALLALAALGLAGAPWGTLAGDVTLAEVATRTQARWLTAVSLAAGIVTAAAVLRAAGRIFLGVGATEAEAPDVGSVAREEPETTGPGRVHWSMALPPVAALAVGLLWNLALGPAPSGPSWLHAVVPPLAALLVAALTLFRHVIPVAPRRRVAAVLDLGWTPLRRLHSGHLGDQVAWLTVGGALVVAAVALLALG